jgi:hypothetical protein
VLSEPSEPVFETTLPLKIVAAEEQKQVEVLSILSLKS